MVVLGCDPGLAKGAIALLHVAAGRAQLGSVRMIRSKPDEPVHRRLLRLQVEVMTTAEGCSAALAVIEKTHLGAGTGSSLALSQARGCWLAGLGAAGVPVVVEITPSQVKKAVAGKGNATKEEVAAAVVKRFGDAARGLSYDESDAAAIALAGLLTAVH